MDPPPYSSPAPIVARDLETASIRSAAPSYLSAAPSYRSMIPSSIPHSAPAIGLPSPYLPFPQHPRTNTTSSTPSLHLFRKSSWSPTQSSSPSPNPKSRHYHSVAHRRASALTIQEQASLLSAALNGEDGIAQMKKRMDDEEREREMRTREDPYLVGEEAAEINRQERLRRENGYEVLELEDKRWDWLLAQMSDWEERDKSWKRFRRELEQGKRGKLARRLGIHNR